MSRTKKTSGKSEPEMSGEDRNNVYYKDSDGKFKPFGVCYGHNYIPDGIWYVRHTEHCSATTNVDYLLGMYKLYDIKDMKIDELCSLQDYTDYILGSDDFRNLLDCGFSYQELVALIVSLIFKKNKEISEKELINKGLVKGVL